MNLNSFMCFLGDSKGYGFVEYQTRDCGQRVRSQLDGKMYDGQALACDWLDSSIVTMAGLDSKLLYVDCLPDGFRDMSQFRTLFSQVANPPYCQVRGTEQHQQQQLCLCVSVSVCLAGNNHMMNVPVNGNMYF